MKKILMIFGIILLMCSQLSAQTITGQVTDESTDEVLPGVNIVVKGTTIGTSSDGDGNFEINVPSLSDTLTFSFIGYTTLDVPINGQATVEAALLPQAIEGEEMVVVGYGVQEKVSLTGSVSQVKGAKLEKRVTSNIQQSLQGNISGLTILDQGAAPGKENIYMRIRGITTLSGDNSPLVIVDGIEQSLSDINPNDIESISVLKDASSTAIYGSRAANGVVLVTTKRAEEELSVSFSSYVAMQRSNNNPEHMGLEDYMLLQQTAWKNSSGSIPDMYTDENIQEYVNATNRLEYPLPNTWYDAVLSPAPQTENSLSISGGNEVIKSRLSLRHRNQQGIIQNSDSKINEIRLNTDFSVSQSLDITTNFNYRNKNITSPIDESQVFHTMLQTSQWTVPQYPDGTYGISSDGHNPLMYSEIAGTSNTEDEYMLADLKGEWEIFEDLTFSTQFSAQQNRLTGKHYRNRYEIRDYYNPEIINKSVPNNSLNETRSSSKEFTINSLLKYNATIANHSLDVLAGYSQTKHEGRNLSAYRQDFYNNQVRSINAGANDASMDNSGREYSWGLRSYFGRLNYSYQDKYLLEVNSRYDGSSRFLGDNKYSFFPSFSAGWRISEENFWSVSESLLNELKIRGSWGKTGNQAVELYSGLPTLGNTTYSFSGAPVQGYAQYQMANQNLKWETTTQTNLGLDAELFEGRVSLSVDYYNKVTEDILLNLPVPGTLGLSAPPQNAGRVDNEGWEFLVGAQNNFGDFSVNTSFNFSINNNTVVDLAGTGPYINSFANETRWLTAEGRPIESFYGYRTDGLFQSEQEIENYPTLFPDTEPGDVKYVDLNEDGTISADDMTYLGRTFFKYTYGANLDFAYKGFNLNMLIQGAAGAKTRLGGALIEMGIWGGFTHENIAGNYWTPDNRDADFPRPLKYDLRNHHFSDRSLIDRSYIRLKNVQLSYSLPSSLIEKTGFNIDGIEIYISGTNLLTFAELNEWNVDPETDDGGRTEAYPQTSVSTLGVNIQF